MDIQTLLPRLQGAFSQLSAAGLTPAQMVQYKQNMANKQMEYDFLKWQTEQETKSKLAESGFLPTSDNTVNEGMLNLFGTNFKYSPEIAAAKAYPFLAMMGLNAGNMPSINPPANIGPSIQPNIPAASIMPPMQMPQVSGAFSQTGLPSPNMIMKLPNTEIDPRYTAQLQVATDAAKKGQENMMEAGKSVARDSAVFNMIGGAMDDLMGVYNQAEKYGMAGDKLSEAWGNFISKGYLPKGMIDKNTALGAEAVGNFTARRNELITRMQPLMSEQFGKEGSNRIMETLLELSQKEVMRLSDPRSVAVGKSIGTMVNLYRFSKGSSDYAKKVGITANSIKNMDSASLEKMVKDVLKSKESQLTPEEKKYFDDLRTRYLKPSKPMSGKIKSGLSWRIEND